MLNLRKKLLVSIFTLMLALVAVSTTTYAWFTMGKQATVSNVELSVKGVDGLKVRVISVNGEDQTGHATLGSHTNDLVFADDFFNGIKLEPLTLTKGYGTYADGTTDYEELRTMTGTDGNNPVYNTTAASYADDNTIVDGNYLEIEFELLAESSNPEATSLTAYIEYIKLTPKDVFSFISDAAFDLKAGTPVLVNGNLDKVRLANALRFSYSTSTKADGKTAEGDNFNAYSKNTIINPAGYEVLGSQQENYGYWGGASVSYYNSVNKIELVVPDQYDSSKFYALGSDAIVLTKSEVFTGFIGRIKVRVWLEGWDSDCFNAIIKDNVNIEVAFNVK